MNINIRTKTAQAFISMLSAVVSTSSLPYEFKNQFDKGREEFKESKKSNSFGRVVYDQDNERVGIEIDEDKLDKIIAALDNNKAMIVAIINMYVSIFAMFKSMESMASAVGLGIVSHAKELAKELKAIFKTAAPWESSVISKTVKEPAGEVTA